MREEWIITVDVEMLTAYACGELTYYATLRRDFEEGDVLHFVSGDDATHVRKYVVGISTYKPPGFIGRFARQSLILSLADPKSAPLWATGAATEGDYAE